MSDDAWEVVGAVALVAFFVFLAFIGDPLR